MTDFDVIVVGGGPAGSTAARRAAKTGLQVLLIDKAKFPRSKPCAGALAGNVSEMLDFDITPVIQRWISGFSLVAPAGFRIDCIPEDRSKPGYTVMRSDFDNLLLQKAAQAGAEVRQEVKALDISEDAKRVTVVTEAGESLTSSFIVGADGINGTVSKNLNFYAGWPRNTAFVSIEVEADVDSEKVREICGDPTGYDRDVFFLYFGQVPHGYAWCFPKRSKLSLGICCRQDKASNIRQAYDQWFKSFTKEYDVQPEIVAESGARFPCTIRRPIAKGRAILVGDAAGFVDSFTGEGIQHAIHSGIIAGKVLKETADSGNPSQLKEYENICKKEIGGVLGVSDYMAGLFYKSRKNMETLSRFFKEDEYARFLIAAMIGGLLPPKTVKRKMTLRMMRTRPRDAISLMI